MPFLVPLAVWSQLGYMSKSLNPRHTPYMLMLRVYNALSKPSPTARLWTCSWAPQGLALLEGVLLTVPPAAMHGTSPLQDITSAHPAPLPAGPG